jgi:HPt (histidine-containing phosphotransfer) domain-containing protein
VETIDWNLVLDRDQLQIATLNDPELMRAILGALVEDTSRQIELLDMAVRGGDARRCARLAQYSKSACTNCGANRAAATLLQIEHSAAAGQLGECKDGLTVLAREVESLRAAAADV